MSKNNNIYNQNGIEVYPFACSDCGNLPLIADVGGFNSMYEVCCPVCLKAVYDPNKARAGLLWKEVNSKYVKQ